MSALAIGSSSYLANLFSVQQTQSNCNCSQSASTASTNQASNAGSDSASVSPFGQLVSNLQKLQKQNPAQLQQILTDTANQLTALAQQQTANSPLANFLNNLAARFQNAAKTGDLSSLSQGQRSGHHHHHKAHAAYAQNSQQGGSLSSLGSLLNAGQTSSTGPTAQSQLSSIFASLNSAVNNALTAS
jgi:hypothetical protein